MTLAAITNEMGDDTSALIHARRAIPFGLGVSAYDPYSPMLPDAIERADAPPQQPVAAIAGAS